MLGKITAGGIVFTLVALAVTLLVLHSHKKDVVTMLNVLMRRDVDDDWELALGDELSVLEFPKSYHAKGVLSLPSSDLKEPFEIWYNERHDKSRIDYYHGEDVTIQRGDFGRHGIFYKIVPKYSYAGKRHFKGCWKRHGTSGRKVGPQTVLPANGNWPFKTRLDYFKYVGDQKINGKICSKWSYNHTVKERVNRYLFYATKTNPPTPVRFEMNGYDTLLISYYDKYVIDYDEFKKWHYNGSVFNLPHLKHDKWCWDVKKFIRGSDAASISLNPMSEFVTTDWDVDPVEKHFKHFKHKHSKTYGSKKEHHKRKHIFRHNLRFIRSINRRHLNYELGVNHFADMTDEEFNMNKGTLLNEEDDEDNDTSEILDTEEPHKDLEDSTDGPEKDTEEVSSDEPAEGPEKGPEEVSSDEPADGPEKGLPDKVLTDVPTEGLEEGPPEDSSDDPSTRPVEGPLDGQTDGLAEGPMDNPSDEPSDSYNSQESYNQRPQQRDMIPGYYNDDQEQLGDLDTQTFYGDENAYRRSELPRHHRKPKPPKFVPPELDWRSYGAVTPARGQGTCGSCWAFSAVGALEGAHFIKTGELAAFSEQQLMDCTWAIPGCKRGNNGCLGGWTWKTFSWVKKFGISFAKRYGPYHGQESDCRIDKVPKEFKIDSYKRVKHYKEPALLKAVAYHGPATVSINASPRTLKFYSRGVLDDPICTNNTDHAVLMVGFGNENGVPYYIIKNSWSTQWGDDGFVKIRRGLCGIERRPVVTIVHDHKPLPWIKDSARDIEAFKKGLPLPSVVEKRKREQRQRRRKHKKHKRHHKQHKNYKRSDIPTVDPDESFSNYENMNIEKIYPDFYE